MDPIFLHATEGVLFAVLGDFNRRLFKRPDEEFWVEIDDAEPPEADLRSPTEGKTALGWNQAFPQFINHLVLSKSAAALLQPGSFAQQVYDDADTPHRGVLSDHCALSIVLSVAGSAAPQPPTHPAPAATTAPSGEPTIKGNHSQGRSTRQGANPSTLQEPVGWRADKKKLAVLGALGLLLNGVGCSRLADLPGGYVIRQGDVEAAQPLSRNVLLIADNQQHYLYGKPLWVRTALIDKAVTTAIRAPQLDVFGPSVLEWVIMNYAQKVPVVHLGDGLNLSCENEYERFITTMDRAQRGWYMAPGNHDGIYFGSSNSKSEWKDACDGGGGPITQATFIERYLSEVLAGRRKGKPSKPPSDPGAADFAPRFAPTPKGSWAYSGQKRAWLTRVAWRIDHSAPYRSYLVQEVTATAPNQVDEEAVKYILLDTSNFEHEPTLIPIPPHVNPGSTGDLRAEQLAIVREWLDEYRSSPTPHTVVLMGHHPFDALTARARKALDELRRAHGLLLYISAHTHRGGYIPHEGGDSGWLELNVGSTVDWPLEFRSFRLVEAPSETGGLFYSNSELFALGHDWSDEDAPECAPGWQPQRGDPDYYIDYTKHLLNPDATAALIFNSVLQSYKRLIRNIPSDATNSVWPPSAAGSDAAVDAAIDSALATGADTGGLRRKRALLLELETFDRERRVPAMLRSEPTAPEQDGTIVHRDYRLCQAIWASQDDEIGARRARPEDWYIAFPPRSERSTEP